MAKILPSPDRLFDRPWRAGHPFRRRLSRWRRWGIGVLLVILVGLIGVYWYVSDSDRLRNMAEAYLTRVVGAPVQVASAELSIFQGIRLDGIIVKVNSEMESERVLFSARTLVLRYTPMALVAGRIEAVQIVAIDPHVRICENLDEGTWNYQRLQRREKSGGATSRPSRPLALPQIILRNATVDYSEIREGAYRSLGTLLIEGRLAPAAEEGFYTFDVQSRGGTQSIGPAASGKVSLATGQISARLRNLDFNRDLQAMLPAQVRRWAQRHELAGRLDIPELTYFPGAPGGKPVFRIRTDLRGVNLAVHAEEWLSKFEMDQIRSTLGSFDILERVAAGRVGTVQLLRPRVEPLPVRLEKVSGEFLFTDQGIDADISGRIEANGFRIKAKMDGYSPDAPLRLRLSSLESENLHIPHSPRYINSLPVEVRELYGHLRPEGTARLWVEVRREEQGGKIRASGEVQVIDGSFVVDFFPYPLRNVTGTIAFGFDPKLNMECIRLVGLQGVGLREGPNASSPVRVNGWIGPMGPGAEFNIRIEGQDVTSEHVLFQAFPSDVRKALRIFGPPDLAARGVTPQQVNPLDWPMFRGDFVCDVHRPRGRKQKFSVGVDIHLKDSNGALWTFPYPLEHATGTLRIRDGRIEIVGATMRRGDADVVIDGTVTFGKNKPVDPKLTIAARNVPIDQTLLSALPRDQQRWMKRVGLGGRLDVNGTVFRQAESTTKKTQSSTTNAAEKRDEIDIGFDLQLGLREGTVWPVDGTFAASDMNGTLRLLPEKLEVLHLEARRGAARIVAEGSFAWPENRPQAMLRAQATELAMDPSLYRLLPKPAQEAWEAVQPEGTLDAELSFSGAAAVDEEVGVDAKGAEAGYHLVLRPRKLSATLVAIPYRLDELSGTVVISPRTVQILDLSARHGQGKISASGSGRLGSRATWDIQLAGSDVAIDEELQTAVPESLGDILDGLKAGGTVDFNFSKLVYSSSGGPTTRPAPTSMPRERSATRPRATRPAATQSADDVDLDFGVVLNVKDGVAEVGVPLTEITGELQFAGAVRAGRLDRMAGVIKVPSMSLAGRAARQVYGEMVKAPGEDVLQVSTIRGQLAGGEMAGRADILMPEDAPGRYVFSLDIHNADVAQLAMESRGQVQGQLSASLGLEGVWSDPRTRRGRGDVAVSGPKLYRMPLVLGLMQITNLSLPLSGPFQEGSARYTVDGDRVTFEQIELRANNMLMQGSGWMDFGSRKVRMSFATDSVMGVRVPFFSDIYRGLRQELFQFHVSGTVEEPKVSAVPMNTFTTTVDEVLRGSK